MMAQFYSPSDRPSRCRPLVILFVFLMGAGLAGAAEPGADGSDPTNASHVVFLDYQDAGCPIESWIRDRSTERITFKKEPDLSKRGVYRARFRLREDTNSAVALAWDKAAGKLYVDLNRNLDLTDDPAGVFSASREGIQQVFTNVQLTVPTTAGPHPVALDVSLFTYGLSDDSEPYVQFGLRSFWQGRLDWQGRAWQLGLIERFDTYGRTGEPASLVLRPWDARTNRLGQADTTPDVVAFSRQLFWQGQAFQVSSTLINEGGRHRFKLEFQEQSPRLAELKLAGRFLHRVVITDSRAYTAVLDAPEGVVKVPAGDYHLTEAWLKSGSVEAFATMTTPRRVTIREPGATNLLVGGPLTNSVSLNRRGRLLVMNYRLVGANGTEYRLRQQDQEEPPQFAVYRDGDRVTSGKFQFG